MGRTRSSLARFHTSLTEHCSQCDVLLGNRIQGVLAMNGIIYLVGLVVIVLAVLSLLGLR